MGLFFVVLFYRYFTSCFYQLDSLVHPFTCFKLFLIFPFHFNLLCVWVRAEKCSFLGYSAPRLVQLGATVKHKAWYLSGCHKNLLGKPVIFLYTRYTYTERWNGSVWLRALYTGTNNSPLSWLFLVDIWFPFSLLVFNSFFFLLLLDSVCECMCVCVVFLDLYLFLRLYHNDNDYFFFEVVIVLLSRLFSPIVSSPVSSTEKYMSSGHNHALTVSFVSTEILPERLKIRKRASSF